MGFIKFLFNFAIILTSTILLCVPLYIAMLFKLICPPGSLRQGLSRIILSLSENWCAINNFILTNIAKTKVEIDGLADLSKQQSYLIIANHQSWVDIVILQRVFNKKVPFLRFFLKKELIWLPFLGLAFWALDFPFMKRYSKEYLKKHPEKAGQDLETTKKTCRKLSKIHFSLINFPEGTRANSQKLEMSEFKNLLQPKAGGVAFVLEAFEGKLDKLIDVSIVYPDGPINMYNLLAGKIKNVKIKIHLIPIPPHFQGQSYFENEVFRSEFQTWVNNIWQEKDIWLEQNKF